MGSPGSIFNPYLPSSTAPASPREHLGNSCPLWLSPGGHHLSYRSEPHVLDRLKGQGLLVLPIAVSSLLHQGQSPAPIIAEPHSSPPLPPRALIRDGLGSWPRKGSNSFLNHPSPITSNWAWAAGQEDRDHGSQVNTVREIGCGKPLKPSEDRAAAAPKVDPSFFFKRKRSNPISSCSPSQK